MEEFNKYIELAENRKDLLKEIVKNLTGLNYTNAIKFAKENKENYIGYTKLKEIFLKDVEKKELTQPYKELIEHLGKIIRS